MFVDLVKIKVKSGNGGNGAVSFLRDKFTQTGGPDGGNGGKGGDILFVADSNLSTLSEFRHKKKFFAQDGEGGATAKKSGKSGENLVIKVPPGTLIFDEKNNNLLADISDEKPVILAKGGRGGAGNMNFATSIKQSPRFAKPGEITEEINLKLELKLLADVGLVGFPNVGKSTFISMISGAKPQVANYHFTTLSPILGVVNYKNNNFVVADIPGLIEGAWQGIGLGHQFLRHVERCRLLLHIVDISGSEGRDPIQDFKIINEELLKFNPDLAKRPMVVAGNKCDLADPSTVAEFKNFVNKKGYEFFAISAVSKEGFEPLLDCISEKLSKLPRIEFTPIEIEFIIDETENDEVKIEKVGNKYILKAKWLTRLVNSVNFESYDSMQYFQSFLSKAKLNEMLKKAGAKPGDTIEIDEMEFDFFD